MPDPNTLHIENRAKDGSYDEYRLNHVEGGEDVVVLAHVLPGAVGLTRAA